MGRVIYFLLILIIFSIAIYSNDKPDGIPEDGEYIYKTRYEEYQGHPYAFNVKVVIKADSISIYIIGDHGDRLKDRDLLTKGELFWHKDSNKWVIVTKKEDYTAKDVGGCSDGPEWIDFKKRVYWIC